MWGTLQQTRLHAAAAAGVALPDPGAAGFAGQVDRALDEVRRRRAALAEQHGGLTAGLARLDARLRTDRPERMDDPGLPAAERVALVRDLHRHNVLVGTYARFVGALDPVIRAVERARGRPARLLELASGSGAFTLALAARARRRGLRVEITGSDIVPEYVEQARAAATRRGSDVEFRVLDALSLGGLDAGVFDLVFLGQAAHHFSPGSLASIVRAARRVATTAIVVVDGRRSLSMFAALAFTNALLPRLRHDSFLSARKFYSEPELALIARAGAPDATVEVRPSHPGYSVLVARWEAPAPSDDRSHGRQPT